jgi:hypothetical protein
MFSFLATVGMDDRIGSYPSVGVSPHRGFLTASAVVGQSL